MSSTSPANPANVVTVDRARFTLLTDRMLRLEWSEDGLFEDLATLTVSNRSTDYVAFTRVDKGNKLLLKTKFLTLNYTRDDKALSKKNLSITFKINGKTSTWWPGKKDKLNLKGTAKTLDEYMGAKRKTWVPIEKKNPDLPVRETKPNGKHIWQGETNDLALCDGLISRNGWALVDESSSVVLDPAGCNWQPWVRERLPGNRQDFYFLGYGLAYKDALRDASLIFGKQPLPPRYSLGYWYSRYWAYTDKELKELVEDFDRMQLPLDVLVIDMDWHKPGWTGYSWDPDFFPEPEALLKWLKKRGVKITLNLHPASGVLDFEDAFPEMLKEMGLKKGDLPDLPEKYHQQYKFMGLNSEGAKHIPLDVCDPTYMRAYFKCLHHPLEKMGVDFWWMDWQQGKQGSQLPNLDTLPWINELHWQDQISAHPNQRALNFSRFGGLGAGRMPVGFSGDTLICWESLAYQPFFTATASNVLYGTWSHDIGGHMQGKLSSELYARWIQFGLYSPILRTHTSKDPDSERRIFHFTEPARSVMTRSLQRRYEIVPYIYGSLRNAAETGVSLLRPMYYDWPTESEAYKAKDQYMFGDDLLVAPVIRPMDTENEQSEVNVWLPKGEWIDTATGSLLKGGCNYKRYYTLDEIPVFVRPGTVIPEQPCTTRLQPGAYPEIRFRIYAGKEGEACLYEDDGHSRDWEKGKSATLRITHRRMGKSRQIQLHPAEGDYQGFKARRKVRLILEGFAPPKSVSMGKWHYHGDTASIHLDCGNVDLRKGLHLEIEEAPPATQTLARDLKGRMTRLEKIRGYICAISPTHPMHADERLAVKIAQTGNRISLHPENFKTEINQLNKLLDRFPKALKEMELLSQGPDSKVPSIQELAIRKSRNILNSLKKISS